MNKKCIRSILIAAFFGFMVALLPSFPSEAANGGYSSSRYESEVKKILSGIKKSWKPEEKLFYLHDYLVTHTEYDYTYKGHSEYDAIVNHKAVCQGYSLAFEDLATRAGIQTMYISSRINNHAWNAVKLNGSWFYIDCTWDDPSGPTNPNFCRYTNFLRNEAGMRETGHRGNDWRIGHFGDFVNGKYRNSTYEKANWRHAAEVPVTLLSDGIAYYNESDNAVYTYKCNKTKARKIIKFDSSESFSTHRNVPVTGGGNSVYIGKDDLIYFYNAKKSLLKKIYKLTEDEKKTGSICDLSVTDKKLRYDLSTDNGSTFYAKKVSFANYLNVSKAEKLYVQELTLSDNSLKHMAPGTSITLKAESEGIENLIWSSDNNNVAVVSNGIVTGLNEGTCMITVKGGKLSDSCVVVVEKQQEKSETEENVIEDAAGQPDSIWLNDFEYFYANENGYINVYEYQGTATELVVPATAIYQGKKYRTVIRDTILDGDNSSVRSIRFEEGVILMPSFYLIASGNSSIKRVDLTGCAINKSGQYFSVAKDCPNLEYISLNGLDLSNVLMGIAWKCPALNTVILPRYFDGNMTSGLDGDWRVYDGKEYGNTDYHYFGKAPANATLKLYPGALKKGRSFTVDGITYKVTNASLPKVSVTKIKGSKAVIPTVVSYNGLKYYVYGISQKAAMNNKSLKSVTIGSCVDNIGKSAFYNCPRLKKITVKSGMIKKIGAKAFSKIGKKPTLTVPADCKALYTGIWKKAGFPSDGNVK